MSKSHINEIIHKIKEYIHDEPIKFGRNKISQNVEIIFTNKKSIMTILNDNTWDEIKRHIDVIMNTQKPPDTCSICFTDKIKERVVRCTKCASEWCVGCYADIFRANKGIIKCPFCRYEFGQRFPDHMIEIGVMRILNADISY